MKYDSFFDELLFLLYSGYLITSLLLCCCVNNWSCFIFFLMKMMVKKASKIKKKCRIVLETTTKMPIFGLQMRSLICLSIVPYGLWRKAVTEITTHSLRT